jgi:L-ribulokinase
MQILSDVLQAPIDVLSNDQTVAIGAALFGALVGKAYASAEEAQKVFVPPVERTYEPRKESERIYQELYRKYTQLGRFIERELTEISE